MSLVERAAYIGPQMQEIISQILAATSFDSLRDALACGAEQMGFKYVALVRHGGSPRVLSRDAIITNCADDLIDDYLAQQSYIFDPVYDLSEQLGRPFTLDEIPVFVPLTKRQTDLLDARTRDLSYAVTVPFHSPGEPVTSCTFMSPHSINVTPSLVSTLHVIALYGFMASLPLYYSRRQATKVQLSRREAECTALVANGKTDRECATILHIKESSVKCYIASAKRKYGVFKRPHLVALSMLDAQAMNVRMPSPKEVPIARRRRSKKVKDEESG
jgi:LuxR family quorum-sensing system transcriptional regulator CciR